MATFLKGSCLSAIAQTRERNCRLLIVVQGRLGCHGLGRDSGESVVEHEGVVRASSKVDVEITGSYLSAVVKRIPITVGHVHDDIIAATASG